jgi:hypothetical protein
MRIINKYINKYGESLLAIRRGVTTPGIKVLDSDEETGRTLLWLKGFQYVTEEDDAIELFIQIASAIQILLVTMAKADKIKKNTRVLKL